jgi:tripartite-type tricarboxylate transporter receptor subunit TctC
MRADLCCGTGNAPSPVSRIAMNMKFGPPPIMSTPTRPVTHQEFDRHPLTVSASRTPRRTLLLLLTITAFAMPDAVVSQDFPNRPIRLVTSEPGGGGDFVARILVQGMSGILGQQIIVDNRSGAIPGEIVARAQPDGYNLLLHGGSFYLAPFMQKLQYDVQQDFTAVTQAIRSPNVLAVHPALAAHSAKELVALAKAKPGQINYGSGATGVPTHLSVELFKSMAGINIVRIPYKGTGPAVSAAVAGEVQLVIATASSVAPHTKSGKLRALAVTSAEPTALVPGVPTVAQTLPGYESDSIIGMFAPAGTPVAVIRKLNHAAARVLQQPDIKAQYFNGGAESVGGTPEQFAAIIKREIAKWGKVIKDAGIREN